MMKMLFGGFLVACVAGYLYYIYPGEGNAVYNVPIGQARQDLARAELPPMVFGSAQLDTTVKASDTEVVWIVRRRSEELFRYTAQLTSEEKGTATRVQLKLDGAKGKTEDYAKNLADNPKIRDLYLVAMQERISSTLQRRPFEMGRIHPAMAAAAVANMGNIQKSVDAAAAASAELDRQNIQKAYRNEAAGRR